MSPSGKSPLSEAAERVRHVLEASRVAACAPCIAVATRLNVYEARKAVRELIVHGGTKANIVECSLCHRRRLVVSCRRGPSSP